MLGDLGWFCYGRFEGGGGERGRNSLRVWMMGAYIESCKGVRGRGCTTSLPPFSLHGVDLSDARLLELIHCHGSCGCGIYSSESFWPWISVLSIHLFTHRGNVDMGDVLFSVTL